MVGDWFDYYFKGVVNGIDCQLVVQLKLQKGSWSCYLDWQVIFIGVVSYGLIVLIGLLLFIGGLVESGGGIGWNYWIGSGLLMVVNFGVVMVFGVLQMFNLLFGVYVLFVGCNVVGVWQGLVYWSVCCLDGVLEVWLMVMFICVNIMLYVYLYVEDVLGNGQLISYKLYILCGVMFGQLRIIDFCLEVSSWNFLVGSWLILVVDIVDLCYVGISQLGGVVIFSLLVNVFLVLKVFLC